MSWATRRLRLRKSAFLTAPWIFSGTMRTGPMGGRPVHLATALEASVVGHLAIQGQHALLVSSVVALAIMPTACASRLSSAAQKLLRIFEPPSSAFRCCTSRKRWPSPALAPDADWAGDTTRHVGASSRLCSKPTF